MIQVAMWGRALKGIPRINKAEWDRLDLVSRWLIATRSAVLVMTFVSAGIAGLLAARDGSFSWGTWLLIVVGLCFAHATNNLLNDLTDHVKGVDKDNYFRTQYGPQPIEHGLMTPRMVLLYAAVTGMVALGCGITLVLLRGAPVLLLLAAGSFFVLFYTYPLKYIGLGEPAVLIVWGPLMIAGGYFVLTGNWSWPVVWISIAYALAPTVVLFGKHIDKAPADQAKGIRTLPVLLGERVSKVAVLVMIAVQWLLLAWLVLTQALTPWVLLAAYAWPRIKHIWLAYTNPRPSVPPEGFPPDVWPLWYVAFAFSYTRRFGLGFLAGLIIDVALRNL